jgi:hypothetical protein
MTGTLPLLCMLLLSCTVGKSELTLDIQSTKLVADGESGTAIEVCNASDDPANVTATLRSSHGAWDGAADGDPRSIELLLSEKAPCGSATWTAPSKVGQVTFELEIAGVVRARETRALSKAKVSGVELKGGLLSEMDVSAIDLSANFSTDTGGTATDGTVLDLTVTSVPAGRAYLSDSSIIVGKRSRVTLFAPAGTESVDVRATLGSDTEVTTCRRLTTTSIQTCP